MFLPRLSRCRDSKALQASLLSDKAPTSPLADHLLALRPQEATCQGHPGEQGRFTKPTRRFIQPAAFGWDGEASCSLLTHTLSFALRVPSGSRQARNVDQASRESCQPECPRYEKNCLYVCTSANRLLRMSWQASTVLVRLSALEAWHKRRFHNRGPRFIW